VEQTNNKEDVLLLERVIKAQTKLVDRALAELVGKCIAQLTQESLEHTRTRLRELNELCDTAQRLLDNIKGVEEI
jgi:hypothetical protein